MTDYATKEGWANNLGAQHFLPDNPTQQVVAQEWNAPGGEMRRIIAILQ